MPIKPQALLIRCPKCSWQTVHVPRSDALMEQPPDSCPDCGGQQLDTEPFGIVSAVISSIASKLTKV